VAIQNQ